MADPERLARKREKTRCALLIAARELVFERGHERIAIQDITERAHLGLGTFYNYFDTKQAVFEAVLAQLRDEFQLRLDEVRRPIKDPALKVAVTLRFCLREALDNTAWNTFVTYAGLPGEPLLIQDESQCIADLHRGKAAGRFKIDDVAFTQALIFGMMRHVHGEIRAGRLQRHAIEDTTRYILRMIGLPDLVAMALVQTRMPEANPPPPVAGIPLRHQGHA